MKTKPEYMIESEADHLGWHRNQGGYGKILHKTGDSVYSLMGKNSYVGLCGAEVQTKGWVSTVDKYKKCSRCLRLLKIKEAE